MTSTISVASSSSGISSSVGGINIKNKSKNSGSDGGGSSGSSSDDKKKAITRIDAGVCEGTTIGVHYDPMIAKVSPYYHLIITRPHLT